MINSSTRRAPPVIGSFDLETDPIEVGNQAPAPVCLSIASDEIPNELFPTREIERVLRTALSDSRTIWVGVNILYDCAVIEKHCPALRELLWAALQEGRIIDLGQWDKCAQIEGKTGMKAPSMLRLAASVRVETPFKEESDEDGEKIATSYGPLKGRPLSEYSWQQYAYALDDSRIGLDIGHRFYERWAYLLPEAARLTRKLFWLQKRRNYGLRTDQDAVSRLIETAAEELSKLTEIASDPLPLPGEVIPLGADLDEYRVLRLNGVKNTKRLQQWVTFAYQGNPPMTREPKRKPGWKPKRAGYEWKASVSTAKDTLCDSGDPFLESISDLGEWRAVVNKDLIFLSETTIHTRYSTGNTTRSTSSSPNVQNFRRAAGIRECVIPRPGYCFVAVDHSGAELVAAAQNAYTLLGLSDMRDKLNRREDLHIHVGSDVAELDYWELKSLIDDGAAFDKSGARVTGAEYKIFLKALCKTLGVPDARYLPPGSNSFRLFKEFRQFGKIPNFGCLGGMTYAPSLAIYARRQGIPMTVQQAQRVLAAWRRMNPDGAALLEYVKCLPQSGYGFDVPIPGSTLIRRGAPFCAAANTLFQGYIAIVESEVGWEIECQSRDPSGILHHCPGVNFVHDEFVHEVPIGLQSDFARAIMPIMLDVPKRIMPDVYLGAEITAMSVLSKDAKSLWTEHTQTLEIWSP